MFFQTYKACRQRNNRIPDAGSTCNVYDFCQ